MDNLNLKNIIPHVYAKIALAKKNGLKEITISDTDLNGVKIKHGTN